MNCNTKHLTIPLLLLGILIAAPPASAVELVGDAFVITATNVKGETATARFDASFNGAYWTWESTGPVKLRTLKGDVIAIISPDGFKSGAQYLGDQTVVLTFAVQSGASTTTFTISSALLSFPAITNPEGRASAGFSITDANGDGADFVPGQNSAYLAQYNGFASTLSGTTFAGLIGGLSAGPYSSAVESGEEPSGGGFASIPVPVSDISTRIQFTLTAMDQASGTTVFVVREMPVPVEASTWSGIKAQFR